MNNVTCPLCKKEVLYDDDAIIITCDHCGAVIDKATGKYITQT